MISQLENIDKGGVKNTYWNPSELANGIKQQLQEGITKLIGKHCFYNFC